MYFYRIFYWKSNTTVSYTHLDVYKRQLFTFPFYYYDYRNKKAGKTHTHTHTHTIRVISGLIHVYFLTFARFLNGKCRTHTNITNASRKVSSVDSDLLPVDRWAV